MTSTPRTSAGARVAEAATQAPDATSQALGSTKEFASPAGRVGEAARRRVADEPLKWALVAAAVGAIAAALVLAFGRRDPGN